MNSEVGLLRLVAQRLVGPRPLTATDAVHRLAAVQAQDLRGALTSVALRTASRTRAAVEEALDARGVVRSWPMRGTLHLVAAADLRWMLSLTTPRVLAQAAARRAALEIDETVLGRAAEIVAAALTGGRRLRRSELLAAWERAGLATGGQRGYHLVLNLAQSGLLCFGPMRDGEQLLVLLDEWVPQPRRLEREEALAEWAERYFRGHGPATVADFTRWTGLLAADVRAALALARPQLASTTVDGVEHLMDPETPDLLREHRRRARGVFLLPGFDEFVLGYRDRGAVLAPEFADRIVPGRNGVFQPTIVSEGRVVGTWKRERGDLAETPFTPLAEPVAAALPRAFAALP